MSGLGKLDKLGRTLADLRNTPRRCLNVVRLQGLYRVDDHNLRQQRLYLLEDVLCLRFGEYIAIVELVWNAVSAHLYLLFALLARYVQRLVRQVQGYLQQQGTLANPRFASQ